MKTVETFIQADDVRSSLLGFWRDALTVESTKGGLAAALPQTLPDGWQMVVDFLPITARRIKLTDSGRTLGWLAAHGQNVESDAVANQIRAICHECRMERDGWELFRWLELPLQGADVHVFAEGLSNIAHLHYLHDTNPRSLDAADKTLRRVFADKGIVANENHPLAGKTEREVRVDYYVPRKKPIAFQILRRKGRVLSTMEQWGYRWQDVRKMTPELLPAMLYDPSVQEVDEAARAIGEDVCALFCSYDETARIHELLDRANK